jgi:hypothetical protein
MLRCSGAINDDVAARAIAMVVGGFYLVAGAWSFLVPGGFFGTVADYAPYNVHFLHDLGAFQVGLGLALILPAAWGVLLRPALIAVLGASVLHLLAHLEDISLGGHPATDLPALALLAAALAVALLVERPRPRVQ